MEIVTKIAPVALAIIMLCLGASLTVSDFSRVIKNPKDFFIGFICQLLVLPIIAYLLIIILTVPTEMALGVMLIAAAPGGVTSNVLTKFADGDVALSVSLTAFISLISIISVPFIIFTVIDLFEITYVSKKNINCRNIFKNVFCSYGSSNNWNDYQTFNWRFSNKKFKDNTKSFDSIISSCFCCDLY